jgi:hypothetical protein
MKKCDLISMCEGLVRPAGEALSAHPHVSSS